MACSKELQSTLEEYLKSFLHNRQRYDRINCCGSSKSLYCTECYRLLIPKSEWPSPLQEGHLKLPFDLDIILNDRKKSATSLHAIVLLRESLSCKVAKEAEAKAEKEKKCFRPHSSKDDSYYNNATKIHLTQCNELKQKSSDVVRLFSADSSHSLPSYFEKSGHRGTFLLSPSHDSIPLSSVAVEISRLVVLDCKWTKSSTQQKLPELTGIQKVHLDSPPTESFFWRWHNAGPGMISTLEAIYFAALELSKHKHDFTCNNKKALIHLMWLFGIQRATTSTSTERDGRPLPFSNEGKELQRTFRRTLKGSEKHLRDIRNGRKLKQKKAKEIQITLS